jgi:hypothetical protein
MIDVREARNVCLVLAVAALGLLMVAPPASAETVDIICSYEGLNLHVHVDLDGRTVTNSTDEKSYGPFPAVVTEATIRWTEATNDWEHRYLIDRVAGTIRDQQFYRGQTHGDLHGQCRRATQKF